jgi:hypothetical protein
MSVWRVFVLTASNWEKFAMFICCVASVLAAFGVFRTYTRSFSRVFRKSENPALHWLHYYRKRVFFPPGFFKLTLVARECRSGPGLFAFSSLRFFVCPPVVLDALTAVLLGVAMSGAPDSVFSFTNGTVALEFGTSSYCFSELPGRPCVREKCKWALQIALLEPF